MEHCATNKCEFFSGMKELAYGNLWKVLAFKGLPKLNFLLFRDIWVGGLQWIYLAHTSKF